jgi:hypothetical protein
VCVTYGEKVDSCINFVEEDPFVRPRRRWHDTTKRVINKQFANWLPIGKNNVQWRACVSRLTITFEFNRTRKFQLSPSSKLGLCPV